MPDETLLDRHITMRNEELISPFDDSRVRGSSYDISSGRTIILALSESEGGHQFVDLQHKEHQVIPPGRTAILQSRELLRIPANMKARISLKADYATRMIFFAGGIVDPGFEGRLWLPIANLSSQDITIDHDESMFRIEFTLLGEDAGVTPTPAPERPTLPDLPAEPVYDVTEVSRRLLAVDRRLLAVEEQARKFEPANEILQNLIYATLAGLAAGGLFAAATAVDLPESGGLLTVAVGIVVGTVSLSAFMWGKWGQRMRGIRLAPPRLRRRDRS